MSVFLSRVYSLPDRIERDAFPWTLPVFAGGVDVEFRTPVTFFVGENGSGKSTLLEAIAGKANFHLAGGNRNHRDRYDHHKTESPMSSALRAQWRNKVHEGFFLRAESFYNFATYFDDSGSHRMHGKLHTRSHGEAFLAVFNDYFEQGLFILDEPEAALSPMRQLTLLTRMYELAGSGEGQFIVATHSPILMAYPGAEILSFDGGELRRVQYEETDHYRITRDFLNAPERFLRHLMG
jgi:predicted ATPase